jgi:hypothetical protein
VSHPPRPVARLAAAALAAALAYACAKPPPPPPPPAPVPVPAVDLSSLGRLGVLPFAAVGETELEPLARRGLVAAIRRAQPRAQVIELRSEAPVGAIDAAGVRALGRAHGVDAVLVGQFWADAIDPVEFVRRARAASNEVELEGTLSTQLFETRNGTALWSSNALGRRPITQVRVNAWGMETVDSAYLRGLRMRLVEELVEQTSADFVPRLPGALAGAPDAPETTAEAAAGPATEPVAPPASAAP